MAFTTLPTIPLAAGAGFKRPTELPAIVHLVDPAIDVMTDFSVVYPVTVKPDIPIDEALERMKSAGVRLLLVINNAEEIIGLITANDIQGGRPLEIVRENQIPRPEIPVEMIMRPQADTVALDLEVVKQFQVGHIVESLRQLERRHILVVGTEEGAGKPQVCGLFSMSEIEKKLGSDTDKLLAPDHVSSLAEILHERG